MATHLKFKSKNYRIEPGIIAFPNEIYTKIKAIDLKLPEKVTIFNC